MEKSQKYCEQKHKKQPWKTHQQTRHSKELHIAESECFLFVEKPPNKSESKHQCESRCRAQNRRQPVNIEYSVPTQYIVTIDGKCCEKESQDELVGNDAVFIIGSGDEQ